MTTNLPATVQLSTLTREIGELTDKLAPADRETVAKHLLSLTKSGMAVPSGMKPDDMHSVYGYALSDVPAVGLRRAVEKIIKGEYNINYRFLPLPPELAAMARLEAKSLRDDLVRLREKQATIQSLTASQPQEPDQATRERVGKLRKDFLRRHQEQRAADRSHAVHAPMSEEKADMLGRIMALPDAKTITVEQHEYRSRVKEEIENVKGVES